LDCRGDNLTPFHDAGNGPRSVAAWCRLGVELSGRLKVLQCLVCASFGMASHDVSAGDGTGRRSVSLNEVGARSGGPRTYPGTGPPHAWYDVPGETREGRSRSDRGRLVEGAPASPTRHHKPRPRVGRGFLRGPRRFPRSLSTRVSWR